MASSDDRDKRDDAARCDCVQARDGSEMILAMPTDWVWSPPPTALTLPADTVHVWRVVLDQPEFAVHQLRESLTAAELTRAGRFHFERDQRCYMVAHAALRRIIGCYVRRAPQQIEFRVGSHDKPAVIDDQLHFNLSHSHELALCAFTLQREIGVDVEYTPRAVSDRDKLAERFFSARENEVYRALPPEQQGLAFFRCWTRKEAFIKAIGDGLSYPLDRFDVSFAPDQPAALLSINDDVALAQRWSLIPLEPAVDYVGAVAVEGRRWQVAYYTWNPH